MFSADTLFILHSRTFADLCAELCLSIRTLAQRSQISYRETEERVTKNGSTSARTNPSLFIIIAGLKFQHKYWRLSQSEFREPVNWCSSTVNSYSQAADCSNVICTTVGPPARLQ